LSESQEGLFPSLRKPYASSLFVDDTPLMDKDTYNKAMDLLKQLQAAITKSADKVEAHNASR